MTDDEVAQIARLLVERNAVDDAIAAIIRRPMATGASRQVDRHPGVRLELEQSAVTAEGLLDISESTALGY